MKLIPEIREEVLARSVARARARNIVLPTFAQQMDHSSHANHQMHAMDASAEDVAGAEETLSMPILTI